MALWMSLKISIKGTSDGDAWCLPGLDTCSRKGSSNLKTLFAQDYTPLLSCAGQDNVRCKDVHKISAKQARTSFGDSGLLFKFEMALVM